MKVEIASLHIYPIKSCGAIDLPELNVHARGSLWDRTWMIVAKDTGLFLTQRQLVEMTQVRTEMTSSHLRVKAGSSEFSVALENHETERRQARVWNDDCMVIDEGNEAAQVLSDFLSKNVRLVRMAPEFQRLLPEKFGQPDAHTGFADQMPFLLASEESLKELNSRMDDQIPMNRFRPNIVVRGSAPFAEDKWKTVRVGRIDFTIAQPCSRCMIINTNQETGARGTEPLKTLASYRRLEGNKVMFGMHLIHRHQGIIRVGDTVEIIS